ncbi:MAG: extracellular solute-binding protein [Firmicutes bacterium]|nr:extracellular solute-binding protein [Bacillota bacterium]
MRKTNWLSKSYIALVMLFMYLPIGVMIFFSFNESKSRSHFAGFSLRWYRDLFSNDDIMAALTTTLIVAIVSAVFSTLLGTLAAIGISSMKSRMKKLLLNFTYIPLVSPEIVMGVSLMLLFGLLGIESGYITLILAHITFNVPYVILSVMPKLRQMDKHLFDAAMDLGCTPVMAFRKVMLPEIMPGIVSGFLMAITFSLDDFNVSYFVSGDKHQTLPILIYAMVKRRVSPEINALSTIIFVVVFLILVATNLNELRREKEIRKKSHALRAPVIAIVILASIMIGGAMLPQDSPVASSFDSAVVTAYADEDGEEAEDDEEEEMSPEQEALWEVAYDYDLEYYERFMGDDMSISVYNWGEYISDGSDDLMDICAEFEEVTGIKVYYTNFATNEELYAKLKGSNTSYDVIFPSDYMVARMIEEDMLAPLNHDNIPNMKHLDPKFMDPVYDPGSKYSIPYCWNTVGIIYNTDMVDEVPTSWDILWDEKYAGEILMFDNSRDAFAIACKALGYSMNTEDPDELREAADLLIAQKPVVQAWVMDQIFDKMENNEAAIAPYYAGDATLMMPYNDAIAVAFPEEGTNLFVDAACIPANSEHKEAAEMFINFLNEPGVAAENAWYIGYATPNLAAYALLDEETRNDEAIYPPDEIIANSEQFIHLSEETNLLMDSLWTEVKANTGSFLTWGLPPTLALLAIIIGKYTVKIRKARAHKRMAED